MPIKKCKFLLNNIPDSRAGPEFLKIVQGFRVFERAPPSKHLDL